MGTSFLPPLFKITEDKVFIGGGMQISKPHTFSDLRPIPEIRINKDDPRNKSLTVTFDQNFNDRYGLAIDTVTIDQPRNTTLNIHMKGHDNFVNPIKNTLNCTIIVLKQSEYIDLTNKNTMLLLDALGTNVLFEFQELPYESIVNVEGIVNQFNDNRSVHNKSRLYLETSHKRYIFVKLLYHELYVDLTSKQTYRMYGPMKYDAICVMNDDNIAYACMKRSFFVHGVYDVQLRPVRTHGVQTGVNMEDSIVLNWKSSHNFMANIHAVQLHDQDGNIRVDFTLSENPDDYVVSLTALNDYRGSIRAYVQYENVVWSPLNYSNTVVFETTNVPIHIEFKVSNDEKFDTSYEQLHIQLMILDMGSSGVTSVFQRAVTVQLYKDEARQIPEGDSVVFVNVSESRIVGNLEMGTGYYLSYEINDNLNPIHNGKVDAKYSTRTDPTFVTDGVGPVIEFTVYTNPLVFSATITDSSYIVNVRYSLFSDLDVESVNTYQHWFPVPLTELKTEVHVHNHQMFVYYIDNTNIQPFYITNDTPVPSLKFIIQATDIYNNVTTRSAVINLN